MLKQFIEQSEKNGDKKENTAINWENLIEEFLSKSEGDLDYNRIINQLFPEKEPADAYKVAEIIDYLSGYIKGHKMNHKERYSAVMIKTALLEKVFDKVENLPALGGQRKKVLNSETDIKEFIFSFNEQYEGYVKRELRGAWRHCGDASRLFSAILRAYTENLEVVLVTVSTYILSSKLRESAKIAEESFINEIKEEINRIESLNSTDKRSEKFRKECDHVVLRVSLQKEKYIIDPTQKQFNSRLDVFSVYKEDELIDASGIIRMPKKEMPGLKSGQLNGADVQLLIRHEDLIG